MSRYYPIDGIEINTARGLVKDTTVVNIFGKALGSTSVVTTEYRTPWEFASDYTFPTTATRVSLVSTAADNSTILVIGLDANFNQIQESVVLTGTTPVLTDATFLRINTALVVSGNPTGDVTLSINSSPAAKILIGTGKSQAAHYTVPAGYCFYLYRINAFATDSNGGKAAYFRNFVENNVNGVILRVAETQFYEAMDIQRRFPFKYDEKQDIKMQLKSSSGSIDGSVFAEGILIKNPIGG